MNRKYQQFLQDSAKRRREIIARLVAGEDPHKVAKAYGVTRQRISNIWKKYGPKKLASVNRRGQNFRNAAKKRA